MDGGGVQSVCGGVTRALNTHGVRVLLSDVWR